MWILCDDNEWNKGTFSAAFSVRLGVNCNAKDMDDFYNLRTGFPHESRGSASLKPTESLL